MKLKRDLTLFWRLLISYLLVIAVSCVSLYIASDVLAPVFLDWHWSHMRMAPGAMTGTMEQMESDLKAAHRQAMQQATLWGIVVSGVAAGAVSLFVSSRISSPIKQMERASRRVAAGQYHGRLNAQAPGEIGELARSFNDMAEALEHTERRRVELLGNVAHELRTPLSSLHGYIEGLEDGMFEANVETLGACKRQVSRLERLVDDLSLLSRVEAGQETVRPSPTSAATLSEQVIAPFRPQFVQKHVELIVEPLPSSLMVLADAQRTGQILSNLVANALRHTPTGGEVRLTVRELKSGEAEFRVSDTGEGIAPDDLPQVFTRFYRADKARTRAGDSGSGIGLTIAKHFAEAQGGRIGVESEVGRGSSFWFTLPRAQTTTLIA